MSFTITDAYHIIAILSITFGFLAAFFGCKVFRLFLALSGFIIVGTFGFVVVYYFISPNIIAGTIVGSILAIIGSVLVAHYAGIGAFLIGSWFGTFLSIILIGSISGNYMQEDGTRDITILGFAIMFGILAIHYRRIAIIAGTSLLGSYGMVSGADHFVQSGFNSIIPKLANGHLSEIPPNALFFISIVAFLLISIVGVFVQYRQMNKFDMHLYAGEEFENHTPNNNNNNNNNNSNSDNILFPTQVNNNRLPTLLSKLFNLHKKVDEVPLLDVVSLEDY